MINRLIWYFLLYYFPKYNSLSVSLLLFPVLPSLTISLYPSNHLHKPQVLSQTIERIIRPPEDIEASIEVPHGLYLIRGDNVVVVGLVDEELDDSINWVEVRGAVIGGTKHS